MSISPQSLWLEFDDIDISEFPPQKRAVKWIADQDPWISYSDASTFIGNKNKIVKLYYFKNDAHFNKTGHDFIFNKLIKIFN